MKVSSGLEVKRVPVKDGGSGLRFIVTYKNVIYAGDYDLKELIIITQKRQNRT